MIVSDDAALQVEQQKLEADGEHFAPIRGRHLPGEGDGVVQLTRILAGVEAVASAPDFLFIRAGDARFERRKAGYLTRANEVCAVFGPDFPNRSPSLNAVREPSRMRALLEAEQAGKNEYP